MSLGYKETENEGQQNAVDKKASAPAHSSPPTAPPRHLESVNNRPEQAAAATSPPIRTNTPMRPITAVPATNSLLPLPAHEDCELVAALPSLTASAPSVKTAVQDNEPPEPDEVEVCDLTKSILSLFNKNNETIGAKPSMEAKKGSATRTSDDSVELCGPYAPADGEADSLFAAAGSWQDEIPKRVTALEDELDQM